MPHRFKRSRASRPRVLSYNSLFVRVNKDTRSPHVDTPPRPPAMATATPRIAKQRVYHFSTPRQDCEADMAAWRDEIDRRIVSMDASMDEFLHFFVPGNSDPPPLHAHRPFNVPLGERELAMYGPLVSDGLRWLHLRLTRRLPTSAIALPSLCPTNSEQTSVLPQQCT